MSNKSGEFVIPFFTQVVRPVILMKGLKVDIPFRGGTGQVILRTRRSFFQHIQAAGLSLGAFHLQSLSDSLAPGARRSLEVEPGQQSFHRMV